MFSHDQDFRFNRYLIYYKTTKISISMDVYKYPTKRHLTEKDVLIICCNAHPKHILLLPFKHFSGLYVCSQSCLGYSQHATVYIQQGLVLTCIYDIQVMTVSILMCIQLVELIKTNPPLNRPNTDYDNGELVVGNMEKYCKKVEAGWVVKG